MNDYVAQALMDIGKSLPSQLRQNRIDSQAMRDKRRQYMSDDLANELSSLQIQAAKNKIAEDETNQANNKAALDALADATKAMQLNKKFSDLNALEESVGAPKGDYGLKSNRDIATSVGLPKYAGNKSVEAFYKMNVEDQEKAGLTPGTLRIGNRAGLIEDYRRPEMKDFVKKKLEEFKNNTGLDDNTFKGKIAAIDSGEGYTVSEFIDDYYKQGQKNKQRVDLENSLIDPRTKQTVSNESAKGNVEALTPKFKTDRKKEWDNFLGKYNEAYQQFALGKNAPDNNTGDVALINSLEKLRELNSAVMYGDYEKWVRPAQNMLQGLQDSGMFETIMARGENRLPADVRKGMQGLVQALWDNRKSILVQEQQSASQYAKDNFGWNDKLANDTYRMPKLGYEQGDTNVGKKPVVTEPTPPPEKTTPLDNVDNFAQREGDAIKERNAWTPEKQKRLEELRKKKAEGTLK